MLRRANNCALMGVMLSTFMLVVSPKLVASELGDDYISPDDKISISIDYNEDTHSVIVTGQLDTSEEVELDIQEDAVLENTEGTWENNELLLKVDMKSSSIQYKIGIAETGELFCNII